MTSVDYYMYDEEYVPTDFGLYNCGACCWFNSLLQTLFSLPAFNKIVLACEDDIVTSALGKEYVTVLKDILSSERKDKISQAQLGQISIRLLKAYHIEARKKGTTIDLRGQEGPANGLITFLDLLDGGGKGEIYKVLNNKYEMIIHCDNCDKDISIQNDKWHLIQMYFVTNPPDNKEKFEKYIKGHLSPFEGYKCDDCKQVVKTKVRYERLRMLRECIFITFEKSKRNKYYPEYLDFLSVDDKMLRYRVVAQIEHSGSYDYTAGAHKSSGHYYARAQRRGTWKTYNDQSVSSGSYNPNPNVHIVVYHLYDHSDMTADEKAALEARRRAREISST